MSTSAERQRKRRERLRNEGIVDVTVAVPKDKSAELRRFGRSLRTGAMAPSTPVLLLEAIKSLKAIRPKLESAGVRHAGIFGSTARDDRHADSDIDVLLDIDAKQIGDVLNYISIVELIQREIQDRCPGINVDVADRATLKTRIQDQAEQDVIHAF